MSESVKSFNLYMAGNILHENNQQFNKIVELSANKFQAELCQLLQSPIKVKGYSEENGNH